MPRLPRAALLGLFLLTPLACDDKAPAPTEMTPPPEVAPAPATQPIADQPRQPLTLAAIPFTVDVPPGWKVATYETPGKSINMLEGPIDGDEVRVTLAMREEVSGELLKQLMEAARREAASDKTIELKPTESGELRIINRRRIGSPATQATQPAADGASSDNVDWRISVFVPNGVRHRQYELRFIGLTPEAYSRNKGLLDAVIASIKHDSRDAF